MCGSKKWVDTGARRQGGNICCEVKNNLDFSSRYVIGINLGWSDGKMQIVLTIDVFSLYNQHQQHLNIYSL